MKYWLFQNNQVTGPFEQEQLLKTAGFSGESLVCPEGRKGTEMGDWKRAGTVPELAEAFRKNGVQVGAVPGESSRGEPGEKKTAAPAPSLLPPDPSLQDLALLGSLQEKTASLDNAVSQLREDLRTRDAEITRLKTSLEGREKTISELQNKQADIEGRISSLLEVRGNFEGLKQKIQELQDGVQKAQEAARTDVAKSGEEERAIAAKYTDLERRMEDISSRIGGLPPPMGGSFGGGMGTAGFGAAPASGMGRRGAATEGGIIPSVTPMPSVRLGSKGMVQDKGPAQVSSREEGEQRPKKKGKFLAGVVAFALAATAAAYYLSRERALPPPGGVPASNATASGATASSPPGGVFPVGRPAGTSLPPAATSAPPAPTQSRISPVEPPPGQPMDMSQRAVAFVKKFVVPGGDATLQQKLEAGFPPSGGLSPWMVERLGPNRYQVNFYVKGSKLVYQFLLKTEQRRLEGLNPPAMALLKGESLKAVSPSSTRAKRARRGAASPKSRQPRRSARASRPAAAPLALPGSGASGGPSTQEQGAPDVEPMAEPKVMGGEENQAPQAEPAPGDDNASMEDLLLPGVPRPSGDGGEKPRSEPQPFIEEEVGSASEATD
ncbi:MAG: hypothetical protein HY551_03665 [Elusimicrobia bacterium]|nr:hypothetical protein [Elusimicrobiota bacterium]